MEIFIPTYQPLKDQEDYTYFDYHRDFDEQLAASSEGLYQKSLASGNAWQEGGFRVERSGDLFLVSLYADKRRTSLASILHAKGKFVPVICEGEFDTLPEALLCLLRFIESNHLKEAKRITAAIELIPSLKLPSS